MINFLRRFSTIPRGRTYLRTASRIRLLLEALEDLFVHIGDAAGGVPQALAPWVLPDGFQELPHCIHDLLAVQGASKP